MSSPINIPNHVRILPFSPVGAAGIGRPISDVVAFEVLRMAINKNQVPALIIVPLGKTRAPFARKDPVASRIKNIGFPKRTKCHLRQKNSRRRIRHTGILRHRRILHLAIRPANRCRRLKIDVHAIAEKSASACAKKWLRRIGARGRAMPNFSVSTGKRQFGWSISSRLVPIVRERFVSHHAGQNIEPGILIVRTARSRRSPGIPARAGGSRRIDAL